MQGRAAGGPGAAGHGGRAESGRAGLVARWLELTRCLLPQAAGTNRWPIRLDHCFMRVCLDAAYGRPWPEAVARPAISNMSDDGLARAVAVAERILARPETLPALNAESLRMRMPKRGELRRGLVQHP